MKLVIKNGTHGRGVFTEERIPAGTWIMSFTGPFLRYTDTTPETYALQIGPDLYIGASGSYDDCVNHCCEPNSGLKIEGTSVDLYAIRDIEAGEEILFDYSTTMDEDDFEMVCHCGRASCRGIIRDAKHLPAETWQTYLKLGILPAYVQRHRR